MPEGLTEIGDATYDRDEKYLAGTLRLKPNSTIRVLNGARVVFECETLVIDGRVIIDTTGANGQDGIPGADSAIREWMSGLHHDDMERRHREWLDAGQGPGNPQEYGTDAIPGTDGGNGGHLEIHYHRLGNNTDIGSVTKKVDGGKAGKPAQGGRSAVLICGVPAIDHSADRWPRPNGKSWSGKDGLPGSVKLIRF